MKLRTKVLLIILTVWAMMLTVTYIGSQKTVVQSYIQLEDRLALNNIERANRGLNQMVEGVATVLEGWSIWDDAYQFMTDKNTAFIKANLEVPVLASADLDVMLFYSEDGKPVFERVLNEARSNEAPIPMALVNGLKSNGSLWNLVNQPTIGSHSQGLLDTDRGILLMASHSILTSKGEGPPHGSMLMGKFFNDAALKKLRDITKLDIAIYRLPIIDQPPDLKAEYQKLAKSQNTVLEKNSSTVFGYKILDDINGNHIAILKVTMPRSVFITGVNTTRLFNVVLIILGLILALTLFYLFRILIINRLEDINEKIVEVGKTKDFSLKIPEHGKDELASLSNETNKLFSVIRSQDEEKQSLINEINLEIERVNKFSNELNRAQILFNDVLDSMPSTILIVDKDAKIKTINIHGKKMIGHIDDAQNRSAFELFPYLSKYKDLMQSPASPDKKQLIDKISTFENGINKYYNVLLFQLANFGDLIFVIRIDDITDQVNLEERLMQNDKLSSIGVLTAGVAHEINNPINFVLSSITPFKNNLSDLIKLLHKYNEINLDEDVDAKLKEIEELKKAIDLDYLIQETNQLLAGIKDGATRTATIVKDLRSFTKLSEDSIKQFDIREGIESSLTLLQHNFKDKIKLIRNYQDIPKIDCYPGRINQVFMNILANAIDSIKESGEIIISTQKKDDHSILINIKDTGTGISAENFKKIFDPFFTTKDIGSGTGLGLSITKTIIEDHHGTIDVKSKLGEGTEFTIVLPIHSKE